jgi:hypothetical protein
MAENLNERVAQALPQDLFLPPAGPASSSHSLNVTLEDNRTIQATARYDEETGEWVIENAIELTAGVTSW